MRKNILIAGPCSIESKDQMIEIAKGLSILDIDYLRGGAWKPRTKPNTFEGIGEHSLPYLKSAGDLFSQKVCTEVANQYHVFLANKYGIDAYWIGARTTGNSFFINEIISELKKNKKPVFVKNPICGDFDSWVGSLTRFLDNNIEVVAVNRGMFSPFSVYRNIPLWDQSIMLKQTLGIKVITDPSHIAGDSSKVKEIVNASRALDLDGLIVEVHNSPAKALTDANQQITPSELFYILESNDFIFDCREQIDIIDKALIDLLRQRFSICKGIGNVKQSNNMNVYDSNRELQIISKLKKIYPDSSFVEEIMYKIFEQSKKMQ